MAAVEKPGGIRVMARPCGGCPFRRGGPPQLDRVDPASLIGQTAGPFVLPCHQDPGYAGRGSDCAGVAQCAGAAVYRANAGTVVPLPAGAARVAADREGVFAAPEELLAHHAGIPVAAALAWLAVVPPAALLVQELQKVFVGGEGFVAGRR